MEFWDLCDIDRRATGEMHQRGIPMPKDRYHTVVHVAVFNAKGEMLIQQRQPFKEGWPNLWDVTVGGSAIAGETSRTAAEREVLEELGLRIDLTNQMPHLTIPFRDGFDDFYILQQEVDLSALTLQESEVQAVRWADEAEILAMMADGRFIQYHTSLISLLFALRKGRGAHAK